MVEQSLLRNVMLQPLRLLILAMLCMAAALASQDASAQDDPPGRVGRIADLNGGVSWFDAEQGQWTLAERNHPLTSGDRISTARDGRAELRIGSTTLRLSNSSELEVLRLDDERLSFQLHNGSLAVRVRSGEVAGELEVVTAETRLRPLRAGLYRVDRIDDTTQVGTWRGELRVEGPAGLVVGAGQRVAIEAPQRGDRPGDGARRPAAWSNVPADGFSAWVLAEENGEERTVATTRYVSAEMTGAEDLDRAGRWEQHPEYGAVWTPLEVQSDWAPYRYGRWAWLQPWGWTWVDDARWGFAPFHYGRWAYWRNNWCWVPGAYVARPVFAPALVAWVGAAGVPGRPGAGWGVWVQAGGHGGGTPPVSWVPLAPREAYRPFYRHTPVYVQRINPAPPYRWQHPPGQPLPGPAVYGNEGMRNGVTRVPGDVLLRRQPIANAAIDVRGNDGRDGERRPDVRPDGRVPDRGEWAGGRWSDRQRDRQPDRQPDRPVIRRDDRDADRERVRDGDRGTGDRGGQRNAPGFVGPTPQPVFPPQLQAQPQAPPQSHPQPQPQPQRPLPGDAGRSAMPTAPPISADAQARPQPERSFQPPRRERQERGEGAMREERRAPLREGPAPAAAVERPPTPQAAAAAPGAAAPLGMTAGPERQPAAPLSPSPPSARPAPKPVEVAREPREPREPRAVRSEGEQQRSRKQDGTTPGREHEGAR